MTAEVTCADAPGKAMVVSATREICANLDAAIVALRPDSHDDAIDKGRIKVVYSGVPSDPPPIVGHVRRDSANKAIKARLKDSEDELESVIVKDDDAHRLRLAAAANAVSGPAAQGGSHLAIEALRALIVEEARRATGGNLVRARAFSDRITELMRKTVTARHDGAPPSAASTAPLAIWSEEQMTPS